MFKELDHLMQTTDKMKSIRLFIVTFIIALITIPLLGAMLVNLGFFHGKDHTENNYFVICLKEGSCEFNLQK